MTIENARGAGRLPETKDTGASSRNRIDALTEQYFQPHAVFYHHNFMPAYINDLRTASVLALIQSPFATQTGVRQALPLIKELIDRSVPACTFIQEPHKWDQRHTGTLDFGSQKRMNQLEECITDLRDAGAHVNVRERIHEKVSCQDNRILWDGSLNILSHYNTYERMNRWYSSARTHDAMVAHRLHDCLECGDYSIAACLARNEETQLKFIGRKIAERREALGLRQADVAARAQTDQPMVSLIESGRTDSRSNTLGQVASVLGLHLLCVPVYFLPSIGLQLKKHDSDAETRPQSALKASTIHIEHPAIISALLARQRQRLRLSQRQLAQQAGIQQHSLSSFEVGNSNIQMSTLIRLSRLAGLEIICLPHTLFPFVTRQLKMEMAAPLTGKSGCRTTCQDLQF